MSVRPSVCPFVTSRSFTKMAERSRIILTALNNSSYGVLYARMLVANWTSPISTECKMYSADTFEQFRFYFCTFIFFPRQTMQHVRRAGPRVQWTCVLRNLKVKQVSR